MIQNCLCSSVSSVICLWITFVVCSLLLANDLMQAALFLDKMLNLILHPFDGGSDFGLGYRCICGYSEG